MKKFLFYGFNLIVIVLLLLTGCVQKASSTDEIINIIRKEIPISDANTIYIETIGSVEKDDSVVYCFKTGDKSQSHSYFLAEFKKASEEFEFVSMVSSAERGADILVSHWNDYYIFIIDNINCKSIEIKPEAENIILFDVSALPFVTYYELTQSFEYNFLDANGIPIY